MNCVWKQVFLCGVILNSVFSAGYCFEVKCKTVEDCLGSTEFAQLFHKKVFDPNSPDYDPIHLCVNANSVKIHCIIGGEITLQEDSICGHVNSDVISVGPKTKINEFPWMALLQYTDGKTIETSCQGVLISESLVMTTATCIRRNTNGFKLTSVRLGDWDKTTVIDCDISSGVLICNNPPIVVPIKNTFVHKNFDETRFNDYNIGLIRLKDKVEFTDFIKPICVPNFVFFKGESVFYDGRKYEIASWAEASSTFKKSDVLMKVDLESTACPSDSDSDLCIQGTRKRNVCDGDEGAPIMGHTTKGNRKFVYLAGIVSKNNSCGARDGPIFLTQTNELGYLSGLYDSDRKPLL